MRVPSDVEMQLLAIVALDELPGREVARRYSEASGRRISYGTLYTTFRRMKDDRWVEARDDEDADGRMRFFRITSSGTKALSEARKRHQFLAGFGLAKGRAT